MSYAKPATWQEATRKHNRMLGIIARARANTRSLTNAETVPMGARLMAERALDILTAVEGMMRAQIVDHEGKLRNRKTSKEEE